MSDWDILEERLQVLKDRVTELEHDLEAYKAWFVKALIGGSGFLLYQALHNLPAFAEYIK